MSNMDEDAQNMPNLLRLAIHFLQGRDFFKRKKFREKKALVSVTFPFNDIIFAAGGVPVFPVRMHEFPKVAKWVDAIETGTAFAGWGAAAKVIQMARSFGAGKTLVKNIIIDVIEALNEKYNELAVLSESQGYGVDACFGIRGLHGMYLTKGKNLDLNLNTMYRCSAFVKYFETLHNYVENSYFMELPTFPPGEQSTEVLDFMISELHGVISALEKVTGKTVTQQSLHETAKLGNECRQYYKEILFDIGKKDFWPCNPSSFAEILTLLNSAQIDCCGDLPRYRDDLKGLVGEMRNLIRQHTGMDVQKYRKVLFAPIFGGYEPQIQEIVYGLGGRTYYGDWAALGYLKPISLDGDMIRNYAQHYLDVGAGFGCSQLQCMDSYVNLARELGVDAVVFNQLFGCRDMTASYRYFKDRVTRELDIPVTMVNFTRIGEGLEQVKTRVQALMEML